MKDRFDIAMIGLGEMGLNLALNLADHGLRVAGYDKEPGKLSGFAHYAKAVPLRPCESLEETIKTLARPRAIMMMVPAGPAVDAVILDLFPLLEHGDILIDGGNSHFRDTDARSNMLQAGDSISLALVYLAEVKVLATGQV